MLSKEDNALITRTGPGTPMGNVFREYWLPAMLPGWARSVEWHREWGSQHADVLHRRHSL
jgi:hypothetical protein